MIRFIVDTVSSLPDVYGNRYHFATITSVRTGKTLKLKSVGGDSNARGFVRNVADWSEMHYTNSDERIRQFNRAAKVHANGAFYEHEVSDADLLALEKE